MKQMKVWILANLLEAEDHARYLNTWNERVARAGHGSCILKHMACSLGHVVELSERARGKERSSLKKVEKMLRNFLEEAESGKEYKKIELIEKIRSIRRELEESMPYYKTYDCACLHYIPFIKYFLPFVSGLILGIALMVL